MRKLLLMFVMLLGSIATMQAQTFNFNCGYSNSLTSPGFTDAQISALENYGFTLTDFSGGTQYENFIRVHKEDANGLLFEEDGTTPIYYLRRVHVTHYTPPREIQVDGAENTYNHYQLFIFQRQPQLFRYLQEAVDAALLLFPNPDSDDDNDGFTHEEEEELDLSGFEDDNGSYQYFYTPPSATGFYIFVVPEGNNLFWVYDEDGDITEMTGLTLREAVDYVRGLPVGQGTNG